MAKQMRDKPQVQTKHPVQYQDDLNPDRGASQNLGQYTVGNDPDHRTAADIKAIATMFHAQFNSDELSQIPIVPVGRPLKQGAIYLDLAARDIGSFVAQGPATARSDQFLVPKSEVPYELWNRLTREFNA